MDAMEPESEDSGFEKSIDDAGAGSFRQGISKSAIFRKVTNDRYSETKTKTLVSLLTVTPGSAVG